MSDEAQLEAERRWPFWMPTGDYELDREGYDEQSATWQNAMSEENRQAFMSGVQWQAGRDAGHIAALEAEVEELQARYYNATAGSRTLRPGEQDKIEKAIAERNKELLERLDVDDELIEAAARAIKESHRPWDATELPTWDEDSEAWRETYRDFARAAESVIAPAVHAAITAMTPAERERLVMGSYEEHSD